MIAYYPYKSDKPDKKYFIITSTGRKIYFGSANMSDFTLHKDPLRKNRYIQRHQKRENWNDKNTAGFWSRWYLWNKETKEASYADIKKRFL